MNQDYKIHLKKQGFDIKDKIGNGLSGATYRGIQTSLNRPVAIKFFDNSISKLDDGLRRRFIRESNLLSELQHPSIPYVLTKGSVISNEEQTPYIVMQFVSGANLDDYLDKVGPLSIEDTLHIAFQILDAMNFIHEKGVIHRDIKPSNIMILPSGHCYLIDFSIGFKLDRNDEFPDVTRTGDHLGSVNYMSPEQSSNMKNIDARSDIFSLTKVICKLLTGDPDFGALDKINTKLNSALLNALKKGCAYDPQDRFSCASDFLRDLKNSVSKTNQFSENPSKALCVSTTCPDANWSTRGYYRGPNFIENSTNAFCTSCGNSLLYKCIGCGHSIENTRYCGGCGTEQFQIPECQTCGSFLKINDMGKDTNFSGCSKCRSKDEQSKAQTSIDPFDEDIPF